MAKNKWGDIVSEWENRPQFNSILGANGQLNSQYTLNNPLDTRGLDAFRERALSTGQSPWAAMMNKQNEMGRQSAMESALAQNASAGAQARSMAARTGGLSQGQQAALARGGARDAMNAQQGINRQAMANNLNVGIQDEQQRLAAMQALPGMELAANRAVGDDMKFNIANTLQQIGSKRDYELDSWKTKMGAIASEDQAKATENAGKK